MQVTGTNWPQPAYTLLVTGLCRFKVDDLLQETPYLVAKVTQLDKITSEDGKISMMFFFQNIDVMIFCIFVLC